MPVVELRMEAEQPARMVGYAAMFDALSENLGGFRERIEPGAFASALAGDVRALWQHDPAHVLGRTRAGTLTLVEDARGLWTETILPEAQWARDAAESIRRGDVSAMSFGFRVIRDTWDGEGADVVRTLREVELFDVSPVTFPAYPQTSVQVRARLAELSDPSRAARELADERRSALARADGARRRLRLLDAIGRTR